MFKEHIKNLNPKPYTLHPHPYLYITPISWDSAFARTEAAKQVLVQKHGLLQRRTGLLVGTPFEEMCAKRASKRAQALGFSGGANLSISPKAMCLKPLRLRASGPGPARATLFLGRTSRREKHRSAVSGAYL